MMMKKLACEDNFFSFLPFLSPPSSWLILVSVCFLLHVRVFCYFIPKVSLLFFGMGHLAAGEQHKVLKPKRKLKRTWRMGVIWH